MGSMHMLIASPGQVIAMHYQEHNSDLYTHDKALHPNINNKDYTTACWMDIVKRGKT